MICISILCFGDIANKFNNILSILMEVIIFPEKGGLDNLTIQKMLFVPLQIISLAPPCIWLIEMELWSIQFEFCRTMSNDRWS